MKENWAEKFEGLSGVKIWFRLRLSLAKNSNVMFHGLLVGFQIITEESWQIVLCQVNVAWWLDQLEIRLDSAEVQVEVKAELGN